MLRVMGLGLLVLCFAVSGCFGSKSSPSDPVSPSIVKDTRVPYLLNCSLDLTPRLAVLKQYLDFDYEGLVEHESEGRAAVYAFKLPWYYPPQSNIQDRHGNQNFVWQNCPMKFSRVALEAYGDKICDLGYNRDWNRSPQAFKVCLDRGK